MKTVHLSLRILQLDCFHWHLAQQKKFYALLMSMSTKSPTKTKQEEEIKHTTIELWYTYIFWWVVEVIALTRILDQLMASNRWMDYIKIYLKRNSIRIRQVTLNPEHWTAKRVLPFQGWEVIITLSAFPRVWITSSIFSAKGLIQQPAHTSNLILFEMVLNRILCLCLVIWSGNLGLMWFRTPVWTRVTHL